MSNETDQVKDLLAELNTAVDPACQRIGIVLAAGHGSDHSLRGYVGSRSSSTVSPVALPEVA